MQENKTRFNQGIKLNGKYSSKQITINKSVEDKQKSYPGEHCCTFPYENIKGK
jgi:hypothetical protein